MTNDWELWHYALPNSMWSFWNVQVEHLASSEAEISCIIECCNCYYHESANRCSPVTECPIENNSFWYDLLPPLVRGTEKYSCSFISNEGSFSRLFDSFNSRIELNFIELCFAIQITSWKELSCSFSDNRDTKHNEFIHYVWSGDWFTYYHVIMSPR